MTTTVPRRLLACSLAAAALAAAPAFGMAASGGSPPPPRRELFKDSRGQLALARASGRADVSVVVAARPGKGGAAEVAREIRRLGGSVRVQDDEIGYVRGRVPIDEVEALVSFRGVQTIDLNIDANAIPPYMQPRLKRESAEPLPTAASGAGDWPPARVNLADRWSFSPLQDLGAAEWRAKNPTFDGRGVTVAVLDGFVDFLLPEMQVATALDGTPTRKVVDVLNSTDPLEPEVSFPVWVVMSTRSAAAGGTVSYAGDKWAVPGAGPYRIGSFDLCLFAAYSIKYFRDVLDRPGLSTSVEKPLGVLWDDATGDVWVDTDQDLSFADEKPVRDFGKRHDYALLGKDDPDTPVRETIPIAIQTSTRDRAVALNFGMFGHGTMVAGSAVASRGSEGRFNGVAPGARLVSLFQGSTTAGMIEGLIRVFRDPRIDVIVLEENVWIAMPYVLNDGRFTVTEICSRLIEKYGKPFLVPANNAPGLNTTIEHGMARNGFGVGAYESRENFYQARAVRVSDDDNLHWVGSWGPSGNGALQPDVLSPSEVLTTYPASRPGDMGLSGVFEFAPGYAMCGGTSCATPVAAGAVSLLLSGAKQSHLRIDAADVYRAVTGSGRYLSNLGAYRQGNGLIQVGAAWELLRRSGSAAPVAIESRGPVKTVISSWLEPPGRGPGIYEREGWKAGDSGERRVVLTRTSGADGPQPFPVSWIGNDGTFSAPDMVLLPLRSPVELPVAISPKDPGVHSALLQLEGGGSPGPAHRLMATVVAAERFDAENKHTITKELRAPRPGAMEVFFEVPPGADAFKVELRAPKETVSMSLYPPDSREDTVFQAPKDDVQVRTIPNPAPGVWGVVLGDRRDAFKFDETRPTPLPPTEVTLTASVIGVSLTPPPVTPAAASGSGGREISLGAKNRLAAFKGAIASYPLATVRRERASIGPRQQRVFDIAVPRGTQRLVAEVGELSVPDAELDLYLFDCTGKACETRRARVTPGSRGPLTLDGPAAGAWKLVVDAPRLPGNGRVDFTFSEYFMDPRLGSLTVADAFDPREPDAAWDARASVWVAGPAPAGRELCAMIAAAAEGVAASRQVGGLDFGNFESWKIGADAIPLGLTTIRLGGETATAGAGR